MEHHVANTLSDGAVDILRQIDAILDGIADLASSKIGPDKFYQQLLQRCGVPVAASAGAVWCIGPQGHLHPLHHLGLEQVFTDQTPTALNRERQRLAKLPRPDASRIVTSDGNPRSEIWALACPLSWAGQAWGTLVFYCSTEIPAAAHEGHLRFLVAVAELVREYEQQRDLARHEQQVADWRRYEQFSLAVHRDGSLADVAFRLANEGRLVIGCDRVSVLVRDGSRFRVASCSGVHTPDRRSNLIRNLERLVRSVARTGEPLFFPSQTSRLEPQIKQPLDAYVDRSAAAYVAVIPLMPPRRQEGKRNSPFAALVVEQIEGAGGQELFHKIAAVSEHASLALHRATTLGSFPVGVMLQVTKPLGTWLSRRHLPKWLIAATVGALLLSCLVLVRTDFTITVRGQLRPESERRVFASHDGFVEELRCRHGQLVEQNAVVATIHSPELELETKRVLGELLTAREKLTSIDAERLQVTAVDSTSRQRASELSADELSVRERIENLEEQLRLLEQQTTQLQLTSPINGTVLDWNLEQQLTGRPVQRGQKLLEVADLEGPWILKFDVPDHRIGHVLTARRRADSELDVSFILENAPDKKFHGTTSKIALATQVHDGQEPNVKLEATFDRQQVDALRPGAAVVGKIQCGRRSIGYVWLHEFYEELRRRFF